MTSDKEKNPVQQEKARIRKEVREAERALDPAYRERASAAICKGLEELESYRRAKTVFCFVGTPSEIDTQPFLRKALASGKALCVPLCIEMGVMKLKRIDSLEELSPGSYGILEPRADAPTVAPESVDFSVIPCLSVSRGGKRLGKGGGFYDRFLERFRGEAVTISMERLMRDDIPMEPHDRETPLVLTEEGLYREGRLV